MAMIKKEVGGNAEDYKYIKDVRNYDGKAMGGVQRATFEGSNDSRPIGALGPNVVPPMKTSPVMLMKVQFMLTIHTVKPHHLIQLAVVQLLALLVQVK